MNTDTHICAWCNPGIPGNHGVCEYHRREVLAEALGEATGEAAQGKRPDQVAFSAIVLAGAVLVGAIVGASVAVLEAAMR